MYKRQTFECLPVVDIEPGTKVKVQVDFKDIILQDNEEDGTLTLSLIHI